MNRGHGRKEDVNLCGIMKTVTIPVKITQTNPKIAQIILSQFGGPDGELGASLRYFSQRYTILIMK